MSRINSTHNRFIRQLGVVTILILGIFTILGSGGGGDDVAVDEPSTDFLYVLSGPRGGTAPLAAAATLGEDTISVTVTPTLEGTYESMTDTYTVRVNCQTFDPVVPCNIVAETNEILGFGTITGTITARWRWVSDNNPTQGQFQITSNEIPGVTVTVTVISDPLVGVSLTDGITTVNLNWEQFDNWWEDSDNLLWQRIASFAYNVRGLLFEQITLLGEAYLTIEDYRTLLEANGAFQGTCSLPLPADSDWNNLVDVIWADDANDGIIDSSETITFIMNECWINDPFDDIDTLLTGTMTILNLDPYWQSCPSFTDFTIDETQDGIVIADSGYELNGGFCFLMVNQ